ncbi:MAG: hypothetical protein GX573_25160 [Chloroflexi bacterium]|nr:hypothetical protein [Chloroflexota bacterium]
MYSYSLFVGTPDAFDGDFYIRRIQALLDAGLGHHVLLSHDRGWYDPSRSGVARRNRLPTSARRLSPGSWLPGSTAQRLTL